MASESRFLFNFYIVRMLKYHNNQNAIKYHPTAHFLVTYLVQQRSKCENESLLLYAFGIIKKIKLHSINHQSRFQCYA